MRYCSQCSAPVVRKVPPGDNLPRYVCEACGTVHYQNPRMVVGCVPVWNGRILLCKRAIEPRQGYWTVPAGFMENDETLEAAAVRETEEEALARVDIGPLLALVNVPHVNQVHIMFRAQLRDERFGAGHETLAADLFTESDIPWSELAFPSVEFTLRRFFRDRSEGKEGVHITHIAPMRRKHSS